mmetsp:Transcript_23512/g.46991  ORF Transcript_23512/g.46991 Transcript_23512/m.46991 type:complete len:423 (+) Transcript_23512:1620-2888(+)
MNLFVIINVNVVVMDRFLTGNVSAGIIQSGRGFVRSLLAVLVVAGVPALDGAARGLTGVGLGTGIDSSSSSSCCCRSTGTSSGIWRTLGEVLKGHGFGFQTSLPGGLGDEVGKGIDRLILVVVHFDVVGSSVGTSIPESTRPFIDRRRRKAVVGQGRLALDIVRTICLENRHGPSSRRLFVFRTLRGGIGRIGRAAELLDVLSTRRQGIRIVDRATIGPARPLASDGASGGREPFEVAQAQFECQEESHPGGEVGGSGVGGGSSSRGARHEGHVDGLEEEAEEGEEGARLVQRGFGEDGNEELGRMRVGRVPVLRVGKRSGLLGHATEAKEDADAENEQFGEYAADDDADQSALTVICLGQHSLTRGAVESVDGRGKNNKGIKDEQGPSLGKNVVIFVVDVAMALPAIFNANVHSIARCFLC